MEQGDMTSIHEFARMCWNQRIPASEFHARVHELFPKEVIMDGRKDLLWYIGLSFTSPTSFFLSYLILLVSEDPYSMFESLDGTVEEYRVGIARLIAACGDYLFNNLEIGTEKSARCVVRVLYFVLSVDDPVLMKKAVGKLTQSANYSILVASGRVLCPEELEEVAKLFKTKEMIYRIELTPPENPLVTALFSNSISRSKSMLLQIGVPSLYLISSLVWAESGREEHLYIPSVTKNVFKALFRKYITKPSMTLGYILGYFYPQVIKYLETGEHVDESAAHVIDILKLLHEEEVKECADDLLDTEIDEFGSQSMVKSGCAFPESISIDEAIELFTSMPEDTTANLVESAIIHPAFTTQFVSMFLDSISLETIDALIAVVDDVMHNFDDFRTLLSVRHVMNEVWEKLGHLLTEVVDAVKFQKLWFFLLALIESSLSTGSEDAVASLKDLVERSSPHLKGALAQFITEEIDTYAHNSSYTFADISSIPTPLEQCAEFTYILINTQDVASAISVLNRHEYLWPSAMRWAIKTANPGANEFLVCKVPRSKITNSLFNQMALCLRNLSNTWMVFLEKPDYRLFKRFPPKSIQELRFTVLGQIGFTTNLSPTNPKSFDRVVSSWRCWMDLFGVKEFINSILGLLSWNVQMCPDPIISLQHYHSVACVLCAISGENPDAMPLMIEAAIDMANQETYTSAIVGEGLADFCIIIVLASNINWKSMFTHLLETRKRFLAEGPQTGTVKISFCLSLLKSAVYIPKLHEMITSDMFDALMMKHEWETAIDYFIIRAKQTL